MVADLVCEISQPGGRVLRGPQTFAIVSRLNRCRKTSASPHTGCLMRLAVLAFLVVASVCATPIVPAVNGLYGSAPTGAEIYSDFLIVGPQHPDLSFGLVLLGPTDTRFVGMAPLGLVAVTDYYPWSETVVTSIGNVNEFRFVEFGSLPAAPIPEPASWLLFGSAALLLYSYDRLRRRLQHRAASRQIL